MKHTIYIHLVKRAWEDRSKLDVCSFDMSNLPEYALIETQEIECAVADTINLTQFELDQIERERNTAADAYHMTIKRLDDRKAKLQCLEMTP